MKKRILSLGLVFVLSLSMLSACGGTETDTQNSEVASQSTENDQVVDENSETVSEVTTEQTSEEATTENTEESETTSESEQPSEPTEPSEPSEPEEDEVVYTFTELSATMYAKSAVNVRDLPSSDGNKLGGLSAGQEVKVTGQCNETSWYRIEYNGGIGYVSNSYLVNEKPAEPEQPEQPEPDEPTEPDNPGPDDPGPCPVTLYQLIDEGDRIYFWGSFHWRNAPSDHGAKMQTTLAEGHSLAANKWWDYELYNCRDHIWWGNIELCLIEWVPK